MDDTILADIQGLAERYDNEGVQGLTQLIADRVARQQPTGDSIYLLTNYTLDPIVGNLDRWPSNASIKDDWLEFKLKISDEPEFRHKARAKIFRLPGRYGLLVGRDINQLTTAERRIVQALIWGFVIMLLFAFIGGLVLSRRAVRRLEHINQTCHSIMSGNLSRRIAVTGQNDDFDQLAQNLNGMLDRIQALMEDIRRVSDNIAHDLKTPLARLRQRLEQARSRSVLDCPDSSNLINLDASIKEADSLLSTFNALLRIARIEAGQSQYGFSQVDLYALMQDLCEFYEPLTEEKQQKLEWTLEQNIVSFCDRDLLFQAIANLIENAIKFTTNKGIICLSLLQINAEAVIQIADNGPGIPASERENVFRRFYRLDRSRSTAGNGLGLSMVAAIIRLHDGVITLDDNYPGLKVIIKLPLLQQNIVPDSPVIQQN